MSGDDQAAGRERAGRDFSTKVKESMLLTGFAVPMLLMVTVIYDDLTRIPSVQKFMFWI